MNDNLKAILLVIYALAIAAAVGLLPPGLGLVLERAALLLVVAHIAELLVFFRSVKLYRGPLIDSIALTLAFGILHWRPLQRQA